MAKRYWKYNYSMGYVGTDTEDVVDLYDWYSEEKVKEMTDEQAEIEVFDYAFESAKEMIDCYVKPSTKEEFEDF